MMSVIGKKFEDANLLIDKQYGLDTFIKDVQPSYVEIYSKVANTCILSSPLFYDISKFRNDKTIINLLSEQSIAVPVDKVVPFPRKYFALLTREDVLFDFTRATEKINTIKNISVHAQNLIIIGNKVERKFINLNSITDKISIKQKLPKFNKNCEIITYWLDLYNIKGCKFLNEVFFPIMRNQQDEIINNCDILKELVGDDFTAYVITITDTLDKNYALIVNDKISKKLQQQNLIYKSKGSDYHKEVYFKQGKTAYLFYDLFEMQRIAKIAMDMCKPNDTPSCSN